MNCEQANRVDLISYLSAQGLQAVKERGNNYWYHSPLHPDNTPFLQSRSKQKHLV